MRELVVSLRVTPGFSLGLATYDIPHTRDAQLDRLAELLEGEPIHLIRLDLTRAPGETLLLRRLKEALRENPTPAGKRPAVMVVGLESTLDYRKLGPGAGQRLAILANANIQRDALPDECPASVIVWLNPTASTTFAQHAPDLWHWRSGTFDFRSTEEKQVEFLSGLLPSSWLAIDRLPKQTKGDRVKLLTELLVNLESRDDAQLRHFNADRAAIHEALGLQHLGLSKLVEAEIHLQEALSLAVGIGDRALEGSALGNLGLVYHENGDITKAIEAYTRHREIARELGDRRSEGNALGNLGVAFRMIGRSDLALECYEHHLEIARELGDRRAEGITINNIGTLDLIAGRIDLAIDRFDEALRVAREIDDRRSEGRALGSLGLANQKLGFHPKAIDYLEKSAQIADEIGDENSVSTTSMHLMVSFFEVGDFAGSIRNAETFLTRADRGRDREECTMAYALLGDAHAAIGHALESVNSYHQALQLAIETGNTAIEAAMRRVLTVRGSRGG